MATLDDYYYKVRQRHPNIQSDVLQIFMNAQCTSPERALTLSQIRASYKELTEEEFPIKGQTRVQLNFLLTIPFICCFSTPIGTLRLFKLELTE
ncbi:uncharacterized protein LOC115630794 [Scaptodrosophila lebanonensis]|uniref:Uncharacterized protein LOC115630794 n=1 Tax=Drosophila lebanonensis TaxID=7225 RepID=A0A6J2U829_DROLE|nr:uncharacterized protein LOC115630794 [Scaptodrosophila lebanonensis]